MFHFLNRLVQLGIIAWNQFRTIRGENRKFYICGLQKLNGYVDNVNACNVQESIDVLCWRHF